MEPEEFPAKRYSIPELADHYKCSPRTFRRRLKKIRPNLGRRMGHFYSSAQVTILLRRRQLANEARLRFETNLSAGKVDLERQFSNFWGEYYLNPNRACPTKPANNILKKTTCKRSPTTFRDESFGGQSRPGKTIRELFGENII